MLDIFYKNNDLLILNQEKKWISFNIESKEVFLDGYNVTFSWEYEKSAILLEVKEYNKKLFYNFLIDSKHIVIITEDSFELKEEILDFIWDVDILIITSSKEACKIFESIESKIVIPYWEGKDIFLNTLWQVTPEIESYRQKWELPIDNTEFVNLSLQ